MVLGLLMCAGTAQTKAEVPEGLRDFVVEQAFWEDRSAQASFETARQQSYTLYRGPLSRGYSDSAHWIRLTIAVNDQPLALRIGPNWLDHITLYDPADPQTPVTVGDRHPVQRNTLPGLGYSFILPASPAERPIWLRLQTTSAHLLSAQAIPLSANPQASTRQIIWSTLYSAAFLLILFLLLTVWWGQSDRVLDTYLLRHAVYTLYGAFYLGLPTLLFSDWLPPVFFDHAFSVLVTVMVLLGVPFDVAFLSSYKPNRHLLALLKSAVVLSAGVVLILLLGHTRLALQLNSFLLMSASVVMLLTALSCRPNTSVEQVMPKRVMLAYYLLIFSSLLIGLINIQGWFQVRAWTMYALILHGLLSGLMMTAILFIRAQRLANHSRHMSWQLQKKQQDMELEQRRRHEQTQFLHMLMHELKTPLSVVSLALGTQGNREENLGHASRAVQDMKAIIDRCVQADQLGQLTLTPKPQVVDAVQMVRQQGATIPDLSDRLHITAPQDLPLLQTDPQLLQIIVTNLLDNAARYSDPLTPIQVSVQHLSKDGQSGLALRMGNTPGLAGWPDAEHLFDKYYRTTGAQRESGTGLGLYLSRQLAGTLGGALSYEPSTHQVEFTLWIPLTPA